MSTLCEFCQERDATHWQRGDWHLCDDCYNRRTRSHWLMLAMAAAILPFVIWWLIK